MPNPYVYVLAPDPLDVERVAHVFARSAEGLDTAEISVRFDRTTGPAKALRLLARVALEVVVHARASKAVECEADR